MCVRSVRGLLDRRPGSEVDDVRRAWGSRGPPWSLSISSLKTTRRAAGGGVRLRRRDRPGCLIFWRCSGVLPCTLEAWGLHGLLCGTNGRKGLLYVPEGEPLPGGGPRGCSCEFRRAACLGGSRTSWDRGRRWPEACPWWPGDPGMSQILWSCMAVRMRRAARWCQRQCSPFISSGL